MKVKTGKGTASRRQAVVRDLVHLLENGRDCGLHLPQCACLEVASIFIFCLTPQQSLTWFSLLQQVFVFDLRSFSFTNSPLIRFAPRRRHNRRHRRPFLSAHRLNVGAGLSLRCLQDISSRCNDAARTMDALSPSSLASSPPWLSWSLSYGGSSCQNSGRTKPIDTQVD